MRVFVIGGTGVIGSTVVRTLVGRGHDVSGLARSDTSAAGLAAIGAMPIAGDITAPEHWVDRLPPFDGVIHAACDFGSEMGAIDRRLLDVLLPALAARPKQPRFVYTGGGWLFGATGDAVATEESPFHPLPAFSWMVPQLQRVLVAPEVDGIVIHPAMVYAGAGGVFHRFARDAVECDAIRVVDGERVRWPLVHSEDLAALYALGATPPLELLSARRQAREIIQAATEGRDSRTEKLEKNLSRASNTFEAAFQRFMEIEIIPNVGAWRNVDGVLRRHALPRWGKPRTVSCPRSPRDMRDPIGAPWLQPRC